MELLDGDLRRVGVDPVEIVSGHSSAAAALFPLLEAFELPGPGIGMIHGFWAIGQASAI